ncbi:MAG TPA: N-acetyltransferase [Bacteroidetes bacterium]|nr:N-acetyltransferase [Bacteroidota bacterium]
MNSKINIETERTLMRNLTIDDADSFYALNLDREVIKYTGDKPFDNLQEAKIFLAKYDQNEKYGVGRLAVIDKKTLKFLGWCGLKYLPDKGEYDIGFRFFKKHWNKGFATETAKKSIEYGFDYLDIKRIVGRAMTENVASIKVLEKLNMKFKSSFDFDGSEGVIYELTKKDYLTDYK